MPDNLPAKKILILVWPETSAYNATFRLARVLSQHGYEIVYALPARWQDHVARQGFQSVEINIQNNWQTKSTHWLLNFVNSRDEANQQVAELCESLGWIKSEGFSLVLLYATLWQYATVLHRLGIPYVSINPCLASAWSLEVPPIFSSLQPLSEHRALNGLQCAFAWLTMRYFGAFNHRYHGVIQANQAGLPARVGDLGAAARHFFLTLTEWLRMPVYYQLLYIAQHEGIQVGWGDYGHRLLGPEFILGPQAVDFPRRKSLDSRLYVGACVDLHIVEERFDWSQLDSNRPVVYCAIGSHGGYWNQTNRRRLVESVIAAFKTNPAWQLLLQISDKDDPASFGPLPDNVHTATWFPQLQILERASLIISHGGFGTVREALYYGVPLVIFPFGVDQPGNAARVAHWRVGLIGNIQTVTPQTISAMVETIFKKSIYRENAIKLGKTLQADNSCAAAIAYLNTSSRAQCHQISV